MPVPLSFDDYQARYERLIDVLEAKRGSDQGVIMREIVDLVSSVYTGQGQGGFIDYNDTSTAASPIALVANTWTTIPNDGQGAFSNSNYPPSGVDSLLDTSTGKIDPSQLVLGDTLLIRNDYTITPSSNNALLELRYVLGVGAGEYTLGKLIGRLDSGSGIPYRQSLETDLIYMGDVNTRDNPITLQVKLSSEGTLVNAGSVIQVVRR